MTSQTAPRELRTPLEGPLTLRCNAKDTAPAHWANISRTGAGIRMGRYLRPGRRVRLFFDSPEHPGKSVEMNAHVIWCKPRRTGHVFDAGMAVHRSVPETALAFAALGHRAQREANKPPDLEVLPSRRSNLAVGGGPQPETAGGMAPEAV